MLREWQNKIIVVETLSASLRLCSNRAQCKDSILLRLFTTMNARERSARALWDKKTTTGLKLNKSISDIIEGEHDQKDRLNLII